MSELNERYEAAMLRRARVSAHLAEIQRLWVVEGKSTDLKTRVTLNAELEAARVECLTLRPQVQLEREEYRRSRGNEYLRCLIANCVDAGRADLVDAARATSTNLLKSRSIEGNL